MKKRIKNIIDSWVTTLIGTTTMLVTLFLIINKDIYFVWEGVAGLVVGAILLLAPKTIEQKISEAIKSWGNKGSDDYTPPPGDI